MPKDIKLLQGFIAFMAVNAIYGSGKQCNKEGKENLAFEKYLHLVKSFTEGSGIFKVIEEYRSGDFTEEKLKFQNFSNQQCNFSMKDGYGTHLRGRWTANSWFRGSLVPSLYTQS